MKKKLTKDQLTGVQTASRIDKLKKLVKFRDSLEEPVANKLGKFIGLLIFLLLPFIIIGIGFIVNPLLGEMFFGLIFLVLILVLCRG